MQVAQDSGPRAPAFDICSANTIIPFLNETLEAVFPAKELETLETFGVARGLRQSTASTPTASLCRSVVVVQGILGSAHEVGCGHFPGHWKSARYR